jgi:hypothetical protein
MMEFRKNVVECDVPSATMLSRELIERAYFRHSCRVPLSRRVLGIVDIMSAENRSDRVAVKVPEQTFRAPLHGGEH